ncbi:hypothetical protein ACQJBY_011804 [Aegilops geniculata]
MALQLPPWFGPRAVLEGVELLVLSDNNNAARGWTRKQIRGSLMQRHQQNQQEPPGFDAAVRTMLSELRKRGNLMMGVGGRQHYTLSRTPPCLPPWFTPQVVVQAVEQLDGNNAGGSTRTRIRDFLLQTHQPQRRRRQRRQPPPGFVAVLRTMLSVLRQRGHLVRGANGPQHYTRQQAPALLQPNPIHIPDFLWGYYLGYELGNNNGLDNGVELGQVIAGVLHG